MTLWELAFNKIPYNGWMFEDISNHVLMQKRENIYIQKTGSFRNVQEQYFDIIQHSKIKQVL